MCNTFNWLSTRTCSKLINFSYCISINLFVHKNCKTTEMLGANILVELFYFYFFKTYCPMCSLIFCLSLKCSRWKSSDLKKVTTYWFFIVTCYDLWYKCKIMFLYINYQICFFFFYNLLKLKFENIFLVITVILYYRLHLVCSQDII